MTKKAKQQPHNLGPYFFEFENQLHFAKVCYADYLRSRYYSDPNKYIFMHAHHFLTHCANIAKLIYPGPRKSDSSETRFIKKERSEVFSKIFGNSQKQKLKEFVNLRNDLEHFGERIDAWILISKRHNFIDMNIGDRSPLSIVGVDTRDYFRNLEGNILTFAGSKYELDELYNIILSLEKALRS